jgi:hypothetical protein
MRGSGCRAPAAAAELDFLRHLIIFGWLQQLVSPLSIHPAVHEPNQASRGEFFSQINLIIQTV